MDLMILAFHLTWPYYSVDSKRYHEPLYWIFALWIENFIDLRAYLIDLHSRKNIYI